MSKARQRERRRVARLRAAKREAAGKELLRCVECGRVGPFDEEHVQARRCVVTGVQLDGSWAGFGGTGDMPTRWWRARDVRVVCGKCRAAVRDHGDMMRLMFGG